MWSSDLWDFDQGDGRGRDHAQLSFAPEHAGELDVRLRQPPHHSVGGDQLQGKHVGSQMAFRVAVYPQAACGDPSAHGGELAGWAGGDPQTQPGELVVDVRPSGPGLDGNRPVVLVDLHDTVHPGHVDHDAARDRHGPTERRGPGPPRDDGHPLRGCVSEDSGQSACRQWLNDRVRVRLERERLEEPRDLRLVSGIQHPLARGRDDPQVRYPQGGDPPRSAVPDRLLLLGAERFLRGGRAFAINRPAYTR
jgi:hypothetical protein